MFAPAEIVAVGRDTVPLEPDVIAEAVRILEHAVEPQGDLAVDRLIEAGRQPLVPEHAALERDLVRREEAGLPRHAIDDAAGATAAEDHRVRPLDRFDALEIVQIAIVLRRRRGRRRRRSRPTSCCRG